MASDSLTERRHRRRRVHRQPQESLSDEEIETVNLNDIPSSANTNNSTTVHISASEEETEAVEESPIVKIIETKRRKDWAKVVAPVDEDKIKKKTESVVAILTKLLSNIPSPIKYLLDSIEHHSGYTIRSYFQFLIWLFYLNMFTFIICFTCIIMPTYIYPNSIDFSTYAMDEYYKIHNDSMDNQSNGTCTLYDPKCEVLNWPLANSTKDNETCLSDSFTASSCCSLQTKAYFVNSSRDNDWTKTFVNVIDGTGVFTRNRLFIGYYQNLTNSNIRPYFLTYNMGLAVFLTIFGCLLITGLIIIRKYGDGMEKSYVQDESFENNLFQYIFARWDYRTVELIIAKRHERRFKSEIKSILLERNDKRNFKFERAIDKIRFQMQRIGLWILTLIIFGGAIAALFFTNRFAFQKRTKKEKDDGATDLNGFVDLLFEYLPTIVVSLINLVSQRIFAYMRDLKLYTRTTSVRHYLIRVILMRLLLLFVFVFIIILQISCNSNRCGRQSELIDCAGIDGPFIHCWETLIGQAMYRLVLTDTAVMIVIHLIADPLQSILNYCCVARKAVSKQDTTIDTSEEPPKPCFLLQPLEFELGDYVLDLTYTQTLCWHGLLFCPFLPLIAAVKNILTFGIKLLTLAFFRKRSELELSPARTRHIFTAVLLFSFVWALLPICFLATSLQPSRGCGPFRLYSHEPDYYIYFSIRNVVTQIPNAIVVNFILKLSSAVVVIPIVLLLILFSCILTIRRNSYRGASVELYKLLYSSRKTHRLAVEGAPTTITTF